MNKGFLPTKAVEKPVDNVDLSVETELNIHGRVYNSCRPGRNKSTFYEISHGILVRSHFP